MKKQHDLKRYFLAGLVALLPLWLTLFLLRTVFFMVSAVTEPYLRPFLRRWAPLNYGPFFSDLLCFAGTLAVVCLTGVLVTNLMGRKIFSDVEKFLLRLPVVADVYGAVRKLTDFFLGQGRTRFQRVVLVEYPKAGTYVLGFLTCEQSGEIQLKTEKKLMNVFVPTTPNPTSGFLLMVPQEELVPLAMSVDDAVKMVISGGLVTPPPPPVAKKNIRVIS